MRINSYVSLYNSQYFIMIIKDLVPIDSTFLLEGERRRAQSTSIEYNGHQIDISINGSGIWIAATICASIGPN